MIRRYFVVALGLMFFYGGYGQAAEKPAMTPIDLLEVPVLRGAQLSPDGTELAYVLAEADWEANRRVSHIWRVSTKGGDAVQITYGAKGESSPRWSPDGRWMAFITQRGDDEVDQIYRLPTNGGEAERLTDHQTSVSNIAWSPEGTTLYFLAEDAKTEEEKRRDELEDDVFAFDENWRQRHLWAFSIADRTESRVTEGDFGLRGYELSRDGKKIAHHRTPSPLLDDSLRGEVWVMDADGSNGQRVTNNNVPERGAELSPDNTRVRAKLIAQRTDVLVAPILMPGNSPYHLGFPGTISLSSETIQKVHVEAVQSLIHHGFKRFLILNAHGGNRVVSRYIADRINHETAGIAVELGEAAAPIRERPEPSDEPAVFDRHAGVGETSRSMYLIPSLVDMDKAVPAKLTHLDHLDNTLPEVIAGEPTALRVFLAEALKAEKTGKRTTTRKMTSTGVWSARPLEDATAQRGRESTEAFVVAAVQFIERWKQLRPLDATK